MAVPKAMVAGKLPIHSNPGANWIKPVWPAILVISNGTKTRKPQAALKPIPTAIPSKVSAPSLVNSFTRLRRMTCLERRKDSLYGDEIFNFIKFSLLDSLYLHDIFYLRVGPTVDNGLGFHRANPR